jgi:hypothetical protein
LKGANLAEAAEISDKIGTALSGQTTLYVDWFCIT